MSYRIYSVVYMTLTITLESALSIGTGEKESIVSDSEGKPYIPGTSIAGVLRHAMPKDVSKELFGWISVQRSHKEEAVPTRIIVSDAEVYGDYNLVYREGVALDEYRTSSDGRKYTLLAVDRGARFKAFLEMEFESKNQHENLMKELDDVLSRMNDGEITLGHKSRRGMGKVRLTCTKKDYMGDELLRSIDHIPGENEEQYKPKRKQANNAAASFMEFDLLLRDSLCVREYTPVQYAERGAGANREPSYVQMTSGGAPVIPGMSWAGVFRHAAQKMLFRLGIERKRCEQLCDELFGYVEEKSKKAAASVIRFEDTILEGGAIVRGTRTAINRFSGGAASGALYTEDTLVARADRPCTGKLRIYIPDGYDCSGWGRDLVYLLVRDLNEGLLHVGGNGSIGRGTFNVMDGMQTGSYSYEALAELIRKEAKKEGGADKREQHV